MRHSSPLSNYLQKLPIWRAKFEHDLREISFDVLALATLLKESKEWLRPCREVNDLPFFRKDIGDDFPVYLDEVRQQVQLSPTFLFLIENEIEWRFDGYHHRSIPIIYFRSQIARAKFLLLSPSSITSW